MACYLGIDGGASKTDYALGDAERVLGRAGGASCKIQVVGEAAARAALEGGIREVCAQAGVAPAEIARVCIGISGYSQSGIDSALRAMVNEVTPAQVVVMGDNTIALEAAFGGGAGVLVIAGTGSIAFGRDASGRVVRVGGWGPAISDEGSGAWIGRRGVAAMMRASDRGESTALESGIRKAWEAKSREEVASIANRQHLAAFGALFPVVVEAARAGEGIAGDILTRAGAQLASLAGDVIEQLWPGGREPVSVGMAGGVFSHCEEVRRAFEQALRRACPGAVVTPEVVEPALGALAIARRGTGA